MNIVLDTNVFISAIFWKGLPHDILLLAEDRRVELASSEEILKELFGVLKREKFDHIFVQAETNREEVFQKITSLVTVYPARKHVRSSLTDPSDAKFLACAVSSGASCLISGDQHLLSLKSFRGIPILTPKQFLKTIT